MFVIFGILIYFKGKYNLIDNFEKQKKSGRLDDGYAKRFGLIQLIGGCVTLPAGIIANLIDSIIFTTVALVVCVIGTIAALIVNRTKSMIKS